MDEGSNSVRLVVLLECRVEEVPKLRLLVPQVTRPFSLRPDLFAVSNYLCHCHLNSKSLEAHRPCSDKRVQLFVSRTSTILEMVPNPIVA